MHRRPNATVIYESQHLGKQFRALAKAAGVANVRIHDLRHAGATILMTHVDLKLHTRPSTPICPNWFSASFILDTSHLRCRPPPPKTQ
jgi:hypothetical protein